MRNPEMPDIPADRADDLHGMEHAHEADLVLFMAGNQFMAMPALVAAFRKRHPEITRISGETLPPGLELKQILAGGARFRGNVLDAYPDVYASVNLRAMERLAAAGHIRMADVTCYLHNRLSLMVPKGNPARVEKVTDLGKASLRISQPDPENEDIGDHILQMYRDAGGEPLVKRIMEEKRAEGTTIFTRVHHRETPLRIALGTVDVGPVWASEIIGARMEGQSVGDVPPGPDLDQHNRVNYYITKTLRSTNSENADKFIAFIQSRAAGDIYREYGFTPHGHPSGETK